MPSSSDSQIVILNGVLSLNDKHAREIMTPIADCLTLPSDKVLDHATVDHILLSGFSRIPIHEPGQRDNFIGMLLVKRVSNLFVAKRGILSDGPVDYLLARRRVSGLQIPIVAPT